MSPENTMQVMYDEMFDYEIEALTEFFETYQPPLDPNFWAKMMNEEAKEYYDAVWNGDEVDELKELSDLRYVVCGFMLSCPIAFLEHNLASLYITSESQVLIEEAAELAQNAYEGGSILWTPEGREEAFQRIHASNMSKLDTDGSVIRRADGKVLKGPNYKEPYLDDLAAEQEDFDTVFADGLFEQEYQKVQKDIADWLEEKQGKLAREQAARQVPF